VVGPALEILKRRFALTASTGVAALHLHGQTLHSWAGIGLGDKHVNELVNDLLTAKRLVSALRRWRATHALVIDEISMVDADLFDKLDVIGRRVRDQPTEWFGGLQLIVCGDFLQLPPVSGKFAFEAKAWGAIKYQVQLTRVYRQTDVSFIRYVPFASPSGGR
jgi:ATP-dependent DNA helicase PIF1